MELGMIDDTLIEHSVETLSCSVTDSQDSLEVHSKVRQFMYNVQESVEEGADEVEEEKKELEKKLEDVEGTLEQVLELINLDRITPKKKWAAVELIQDLQGRI